MSEMMDVAHFLAQKLVVTFELPPPLMETRGNHSSLKPDASMKIIRE
jgi:hypothetical protein